jgi:ribosomal protein S18 acetylase RimI-like enzyme
VSPFAALDPTLGRQLTPDDERWHALSKLAEPGGAVTLAGAPDLLARLPNGWQLQADIPGVQLIADDTLSRQSELGYSQLEGSGPRQSAKLEEPRPVDRDIVRLGPDDVADMLDLVRRTEPGPLLPRTHVLGRYLGIRHCGTLVAMAGERMHPPGWTEISAVCTDPAYRGQGLARRLTQAVASGIRARGEIPFLHTAASNTPAIALYRSIGLTLRKELHFYLLRAPDTTRG